jgi:hypothetical protein
MQLLHDQALQYEQRHGIILVVKSNFEMKKVNKSDAWMWQAHVNFFQKFPHHGQFIWQ